MKITQVKVYHINKDNLKAFASVTLDDEFAVTGIKVMDGRNGLFVSMPSHKNNKGEYKDICFPITKDFRAELINAVLKEYEGEDFTPVEISEDDLPF